MRKPKKNMSKKIFFGLILLLSIVVVGYLILKPDLDSDKANVALKQEETSQIFKTLIEYKSIRSDSLINSQLLPFLVHEKEYTEDGLSPPSPPPSLKGTYINEEYLIHFLNSDQFIREPGFENKDFLSKEEDLKHLKRQIENSKEWAKETDIKDYYSAYKYDRNEKEGYHFYTPLFNSDSTEVYIQVDFYEGVYGDGTGYFLIKENGVWKVVGSTGIWMT